jgi:hypothetical protein
MREVEFHKLSKERDRSEAVVRDLRVRQIQTSQTSAVIKLRKSFARNVSPRKVEGLKIWIIVQMEQIAVQNPAPNANKGNFQTAAAKSPRADDHIRRSGMRTGLLRAYQFRPKCLVKKHNEQ